MIRSFEKTQSFSCLSPRANRNGRVPVFAVSASLVEREFEKYSQAGFDGWILKPVDFKRLNLLLKGIVDDEARNNCIYEKGKWEQGGWFATRESQGDMYSTNTSPSQRRPTLEGIRLEQGARVSDEGSITPTDNPHPIRSVVDDDATSTTESKPEARSP